MEALSDDERAFLKEWLWLAEKSPGQMCFGHFGSACKRLPKEMAFCGLCQRIGGGPATVALQVRIEIVKRALGLLDGVHSLGGFNDLAKSISS
jgi:hypothetical protein